MATKLGGTAAHESIGAASWIGANFWSRSGRAAHVEPVRQRGSCARSSPSWPTTGSTSRARSATGRTSCRSPGGSTRMLLERFRDFLDAHVEHGLGTIPTFIVGHMSGRELGSGAGGRGATSTATSGSSSQQAWLAGEIARRFGDHPAVVGWLVSNEMPLYGGAGHDARRSCAWARLVVQAVRAAGATQPISLGDGAWGVETTGADNGYSLRALAPLVDFVGPHVYPMEDDEVRQFLTAAFVCELAGGFGRPVVLEEFGVSSDFASDEQAAAYYRQVLHTTLLAGARGWIAWNNCDYDDLRDEDPYRHHVFELHFGLTDSHGRPKPQLRELGAVRAARRRARAAGLGAGARGRRAARPRALRARASVHLARVPAGHPGGAAPGRTSRRARPTSRSRSPRERDGIPGPASLVLAPSTKLLTARRARPAAGARAPAARRSTSRTSPGAPRASAGRGSPGSTRSSASGIGCATGSSTRSRTTSSRSTSSSRSATSSRDAADVRASPARRARARTCPSTRPGRTRRRDRRATAAPRSSATSSGTARPSSARTRSSTWRRRRRASNPESTWRIYSALADRRGRAPAGAGRRPARARRSRAHRRDERSPSSSTAPPRRSRWSRSSRTASSSRSPGGVRDRPVRGRDRRALGAGRRRGPGARGAQFAVSRFRVAADGAAGKLLDIPTKGVMRPD